MFGKRFELFKLFGFPIRIDLSWFIVAVLVTWTLATLVFPQDYEGLGQGTYWGMGVVGALGLFLSIVLHELGHALVARQYGVPMGGITLFIFGGVAEMSADSPSAKAEFMVAIGGPLVSVLIAALCLGTAELGGSVEWPMAMVGVVHYLGVINAAVVVFNMVPAFPLDGGRVLRSILWYWKGSLRWATRVTSRIGGGFGLFLIGAGILTVIRGALLGGLWLCLIGLFLRSVAQGSYQQLLMRQALEGEPVRRFMQPNPVAVPASTTVQQLVDDYIYRHHSGMFPVLEGERLLGWVTMREVKRLARDQWPYTTVDQIAEPCTEHNTVNPDTDTMEAVLRMHQKSVSELLVVQDRRLHGILNFNDLMRFVSTKAELEK